MLKGRAAKSYGSTWGTINRASDRISSKSSKTLGVEEVYQLVSLKAYELFEKRGWQHGHDLEDWLEAERLVTQELSR